jgi:hypothetical protein
LPVFNDDAGIAVLISSGKQIDQLSYNEKMHFALVKNKEGVSLERSKLHKPTSEAGNLRSATSASGGATPGYQNSQQSDVVETNEDKTNDVPVVPRDIRSLGNGFYSTQVRSGGESVPAFHRRISGRNDILSLGTRRTISTQDQIIDINHFQSIILHWMYQS